MPIRVKLLPDPTPDLIRKNGDNPHFELLLNAWTSLDNKNIELVYGSSLYRNETLGTLLLWPDFYLEDCINSLSFRIASHLDLVLGSKISIKLINARVKRLCQRINNEHKTLFWQVHEIKGHHINSKYEAADFAIRKTIARKATAVFVTEKCTIELVSDYFGISSEKIRVSNLGSYRNYYGELINQKTAREVLGIPANKTVILVFGRARRETDFKTIFQKLIEKGYFLVLAGQGYDLLEADNASHISFEGFVNRNQVAELFSATDYVLKPESNYLNSGVIRLAISYSKPVIAVPYGATVDMAKDCIIEIDISDPNQGWIEKIKGRDTFEYLEMTKAANKSDLERSWQKAAEIFDAEIFEFLRKNN